MLLLVTPLGDKSQASCPTRQVGFYGDGHVFRYKLPFVRLMTIITIVTIKRRQWTVAQAKAKFSEVIHRAKAEGPQTVTCNGRTAAVIVAADEWERKTKRKGNLAEFFASSPLRGSNLRLRRVDGKLRRVDL
jgi:prevent-host-death family protein